MPRSMCVCVCLCLFFFVPEFELSLSGFSALLIYGLPEVDARRRGEQAWSIVAVLRDFGGNCLWKRLQLLSLPLLFRPLEHIGPPWRDSGAGRLWFSLGGHGLLQLPSAQLYVCTVSTCCFPVVNISTQELDKFWYNDAQDNSTDIGWVNVWKWRRSRDLSCFHCDVEFRESRKLGC